MRGLPIGLQNASTAPADLSKRNQDDKPLLSELEKHITFNLEEQSDDFVDKRQKRRKRVAKRGHLIGAILFFIGLIVYLHVSKVCKMKYDRNGPELNDI